jgi:hypothetical protein
VDRVASEHEHVQVQRARPPARALAPPERTLQPLERDEQRKRPGDGIGAARDIERDGRVAELGLDCHADRHGGVKARDGDEPHAR